MNRIVLDASAGVELLLNTARARSLAGQFPVDAEWWVPEHYFVEVAGALRHAEMNGSATPAHAPNLRSDRTVAASSTNVALNTGRLGPSPSIAEVAE